MGQFLDPQGRRLTWVGRMKQLLIAPRVYALWVLTHASSGLHGYSVVHAPGAMVQPWPTGTTLGLGRCAEMCRGMLLGRYAHRAMNFLQNVIPGGGATVSHVRWHERHSACAWQGTVSSLWSWIWVSWACADWL